MPKAYYNEIDSFAAAWLRELIRAGLIMDGEVDERDIRDVEASDLAGFTRCHFFAGIAGWDYALQLAGWPDDRPVWTGSCPCQPFSSAGNGKGADDERHLWPEFARLIGECLPATVFGEQAPSPIWLEGFACDLELEGYACGACVLRASEYEASHERRRLYWVASDASGERQPQSRKCKQDPSDYAQDAFGEADRFVDAVRRKALPFLCRGHDGISGRVGQVACTGFGNAIVPQVGAEFIGAYLDALSE